MKWFSTRQIVRLSVSLILLLLVGAGAQADYNDDIGFTALAAELGPALPDGSNIDVMHVEARVLIDGVPAWMPDALNTQFSGKTIVDETGAIGGLSSPHATGIGRSFYGNQGSIAPGISFISMFLADHWLDSGFIRATSNGGKLQPKSSSGRISNHSWVGSAGALDTDILRRVDWLVETDEFLHIVGLKNGGTNQALLSSAYNTISGGRTDGVHAIGSAVVDSLYTAGRTRPDLVTPTATTSQSAAKISSAATLLVSTGNADPSLSTDPAQTFTINRAGGTVYNAERSEVIRAALMAGASRKTSNTTEFDITDYRVNAGDQTSNGLDRRFGAGQLDIYNSYMIIASGEQNSIEDQNSSGGTIGSAGFDYDPFFGGSNSSNSAASYFFSTAPGPLQFIAALIWNLDIDGGSQNNFDGGATVRDLDLFLFDVTDPGNPILVSSSESTTENTEHLWVALESNRSYSLRVTAGAGQSAFLWDYGLAWNRVAVDVEALGVTTTSLPSVWKNVAYPATSLVSTGGYGQKTWSISSGSLPPGLVLSEQGVITGTPASSTGSPFGLTVLVTDEQMETATRNLSITVFAVLSCTNCHSNPDQ